MFKELKTLKVSYCNRSFYRVKHYVRQPTILKEKYHYESVKNRNKSRLYNAENQRNKQTISLPQGSETVSLRAKPFRK